MAFWVGGTVEPSVVVGSDGDRLTRFLTTGNRVGICERRLQILNGKNIHRLLASDGDCWGVLVVLEDAFASL